MYIYKSSVQCEWIGNYSYSFMWDVFNQPCPNLNVAANEAGRVMASHGYGMVVIIYPLLNQTTVNICQ